MPRGRHRHSPPLHRLLPPAVIAGVSVVCALGTWFFTESLGLRGLASASAATTVVGAAIMRRWDVGAGKRVADLTRARASDEWRHEERVAELETDLEESRELRVRLEHKLRAKRAELANLRNEHAALLRRYATAETERASALEGRRLLEIEAATDAGASATGEKAEVASAAVPGAFSPAGSALYLKANSALDRLLRGGTAVKGEPKSGASATAAEDDGPGDDDPERAGVDASGEGDEGAGADSSSDSGSGPGDASGRELVPAARSGQPAGQSTGQSGQASGHFTVPTAVAVVPSSPRRPGVEGGFDFFGTQKEASPKELEAVQNEDLADVVGQEALALHKEESESGFKPVDESARGMGVGQVIDLTAHDETEAIDVEGLRSAAS